MSTLISYVDPVTLSTAVIECDLITEETHEFSAQISSHPVEDGVDMSDHVRPDLQILNLKLVVSDTPINRVWNLGLSDGVFVGQQESKEVPGRTSRQLTQFNISGGYAPLTLPGNVPLIGNISVPNNGFRRRFVPAEFKPSEWGFGSNSVNGYFLDFADTPLKRCWGTFDRLQLICSKGFEVQVSTDLWNYDRMLIKSVKAPRDGTTGVEFSIQLQELRTAKTQKTFVKRRAKPVEKRAVAQAEQGKKVAPQTVPDSKTVLRVLLDQAAKGLGF